MSEDKCELWGCGRSATMTALVGVTRRELTALRICDYHYNMIDSGIKIHASTDEYARAVVKGEQP